MTFVKKMILLLLINQAEMNIIHKYKCNFSVLKDQRANILHGLQKNGDSVCIDVQYNKTFVSNILP